MAVIGKVSFVQGKVVAEDAAGNQRVLALGDDILDSEIIIASAGASIEISMQTGDNVVIADGQSWTPSAETFTPAADFAATDATLSPEDLALQEALLAGADPTQLGEATAAGAPAAGAGTFGGDGARLTEAMVADGHDAIYDDATGDITLNATGVNGIEVNTAAGVGTGTVQLVNNNPGGGAYTGTVDGDQAVTSTLNLTSPNKIGISDSTAGADVAEYLGTQTTGSAVTATGAESALLTVESIDISGSDATGAQSALQTIDAALAQIDSQRADLGAVQNRFSHTISNLANVQQNVADSRSRIQDTDFAAETAVMTKNQILQQAGTSILAQSNQLPQAALSLLG